MKALNELTINTNTYPELIDKLENSDPKVRIATLRTLSNLQYSYQYKQFLENNIDDILEPLHNFILSPVSREEHDEALNYICHIVLVLFKSMDSTAIPIVQGLISRLPSCDTEESYRFFAIAFIIVFGMTNDQILLDAFTQMVELFMNKHKRTSEYNEEIKSEVLEAITLLAASIPPNVFITDLLSQAETIVDRALQSKKPSIIINSLHLLNVIIGDAIFVESDEINQPQTIRLTSKYTTKLDSVISKLGTKADTKAVKEKVDELKQSLSGQTSILKLKFNEQDIVFNGARTIAFVDGVRRVCKGNFQIQMENNKNLQNYLGFKLLKIEDIKRQQKIEKKETKAGREENTKMRQQRLNKARSKKDFKVSE